MVGAEISHINIKVGVIEEPEVIYHPKGRGKAHAEFSWFEDKVWGTVQVLTSNVFRTLCLISPLFQVNTQACPRNLSVAYSNNILSCRASSRIKWMNPKWILNFQNPTDVHPRSHISGCFKNHKTRNRTPIRSQRLLLTDPHLQALSSEMWCLSAQSNRQLTKTRQKSRTPKSGGEQTQTLFCHVGFNYFCS